MMSVDEVDANFQKPNHGYYVQRVIFEALATNRIYVQTQENKYVPFLVRYNDDGTVYIYIKTSTPKDE